jgi:hypothetical protein
MPTFDISYFILSTKYYINKYKIEDQKNSKVHNYKICLFLFNLNFFYVIILNTEIYYISNGKFIETSFNTYFYFPYMKIK